jgi:hypothetical protein
MVWFDQTGFGADGRGLNLEKSFYSRGFAQTVTSTWSSQSGVARYSIHVHVHWYQTISPEENNMSKILSALVAGLFAASAFAAEPATAPTTPATTEAKVATPAKVEAKKVKHEKKAKADEAKPAEVKAAETKAAK